MRKGNLWDGFHAFSLRHSAQQTFYLLYGQSSGKKTLRGGFRISIATHTEYVRTQGLYAGGGASEQNKHCRLKLDWIPPVKHDQSQSVNSETQTKWSTVLFIL